MNTIEPVNRLKYTVLPAAFLIVICLVIFLLRWWLPERSYTYTGPRALFDSAFAMVLLGLILLLAGSLGYKVLDWMRIRDSSPLESSIFSLALGLGILSYGMLALGLAGWWQILPIYLLLVLVGLISWRELLSLVHSLPKLLSETSRSWRGSETWKKIFGLVLLIVLFAALLQALTPPTDPDGLIDHLQVPKLFLQVGRIYPMPNYPFANYPLVVEALFAIGMAFGSDVSAKLIHFTFGLLLILATLSMGNRLLSSDGSWVAVVILMGMPILPVWASLAYIDMGWTLYEFLAVYSFIQWIEQEKQNRLVLAGVFTGLAIGSKYLAALGALALGLCVLLHARKKGWKNWLASGFTFAGTSLIVASPWLIKNWIWMNNPVYPFFLHGMDSTLRTFESFSIFDYLLLPWYLYSNREKFVGVYGTIEFPSLLFPLALFYPFVRRTKLLNWLAGITLLRYTFWALVSHLRFRYLLPAFPGLSLLAASVIVYLIRQPDWGRPSRILFAGINAGMLVVTLVYSLLFLLDVRPLGVIIGWESKDQFLRREVSDYPAVRYVQENLPPRARVLMLWDPRAYYCDDRCLPDYYLEQWVKIVSDSADVSSVVTKLREKEITHLLLDKQSADYKLQLTPSDAQISSVKFLKNSFVPACTREVYQDEWTTLYELICR